jgi:hypothetical protein
MISRTTGMTNAVRCRIASADLRYRSSAILRDVIPISITVVFLVLLGYFGHRVYRYQRELLDQAQPTAIIADCVDPHDLQLTWTDDRIREVVIQTAAAVGWPKVEVGVRVSLGTGPQLSVAAESTIPDDPETAPHRMTWGNGVSSSSLADVVLSEKLFHKLGGLSTPNGPNAKSLQLELCRTIEGQFQTHRIAVQLVGLTKQPATDRVYLSLDCVRQLDRWAQGHRDAQLENDGAVDIGDAAIHAYGPVTESHRVNQELAPHGLTAEALGEVSVLQRDRGTGAISKMIDPTRDRSQSQFRNTEKDRPLMKYRIVSSQSRRISPNVSGAIALSYPTFIAAVPEISEPGRFGSREWLVRASNSSDPEKHLSSVVEGGWLGEKPNEAVIPKTLAIAVFPTIEPKSCINQQLQLTFNRVSTTAFGDPPIELTFNVVGLHEGSDVFVNPDLVRGVRAWRQREAIYNQEASRFESPRVVYDRVGHVRAKFHARSANEVEQLVQQLEQRGYRCESRLADLQSLQQFAHILAGFVALLGLGYATQSTLTVGNTTAMMIQARRFEIGVLKSFGLSTWDIVAIYAGQGLAIGLIAAIVGFGISIAIEPVFSEAWRVLLRLPDDALTGSLVSDCPVWLWIIVLAATADIAVFGAVIPAYNASKLPPVKLLRPNE